LKLFPTNHQKKNHIEGYRVQEYDPYRERVWKWIKISEAMNLFKLKEHEIFGCEMDGNQ
jgi:hypothetical protein